MKRKGLPIGVGIALVAILIAAAVALFVFQTAQNGWVIDSKNAARMAVVIIGLLLTLVKLITRSGSARSLSVYEKAYKKEIGNAFSRPDTKKYKRTLLRATALYNENRFDAAIKLLTELENKCNTADDYCAVLFFLALCYSDSGMIDEGIFEYEKLLKYNEKNSTAWSNLGILYANRGRAEDANRCYRNAVLHDPNDAYAWNNIAQGYVSAGEWKKVIEPAERALSIKENMYQSDSALAIAYCALGDREKSKKHYDRAVMNGSNAQKLSTALNNILAGYFPFGDEAGNEENEAIARAVGFLKRDSALPMVKIGLPAPDDGNYTRIGGKAIDENVPLDNEGKPMRLLAAIWCSEVRGVPDFPERGVLRFYISDNNLYGADFDDPYVQSGFRVLYDEDESTFETKLEDDPDVSFRFPVKHVLPVRLSPTMGSVLATDYRFEDCLTAALKKAGFEEGIQGISEAAYDRIYDENSYGGHRIGGYPCFEQTDPREDDEKLRKYDTLLLQIVSHTMPGDGGKDNELIMFGDEGSCQFFIPREKLRARDFSDVMFWWDCC